MDNKTVLDKVKEDNVKFVILQFSDIHGLPKSFTIPTTKVEDALKDGIWFDGSSVQGFTRIAESDMFLKPDPTTYGILEWVENGVETDFKPVFTGRTARLICDVYTPEGQPFAGDPRYILKKIMEQARQMGYIYKTGVELEFFLFEKDAQGQPLLESKGNGYYFNADTSKMAAIKDEIIRALSALNIEVEVSHLEVAHNQHEIDFKYADALTSADNAMTFKFVVKSIAEKHNLYASFMPKPIFGIAGSGMHTHQSLFNLNDDKNLFYDEKGHYNLSDIAQKFMAGILHHIKEICALVAPTVNSYKRLTPGYEAPVYICWARQNRSALIRIPRTTLGKTIATRFELRCPDPSANPYLAFAGMLSAGLKGIKENYELPEPSEEDVYKLDEAKLSQKKIDRLPASLSEALAHYQQSDLVKQTLGEHIFREFYKAKLREWNEFRIAVTDWEKEKYLGVL
ncbi:MAG: type I glutamate--ammonia ligase [Candidatus Jacksonbacteria bacterium]